MCLNTIAGFGSSFAHFFSLVVQFCYGCPSSCWEEQRPPATRRVGPVTHRCPFLALAGINMASPPYPCALQALDQQPGCAWSGELLPQHVPDRAAAQAQRGGCLQSTWTCMQLFPAQQSCASPSLEIKVLTRSQLLSPVGICPVCLQENSYALESFTAIIPKFRQQWTHMQQNNSDSSFSVFYVRTELVLVTYNS